MMTGLNFFIMENLLPKGKDLKTSHNKE